MLCLCECESINGCRKLKFSLNVDGYLNFGVNYQKQTSTKCILFTVNWKSRVQNLVFTNRNSFGVSVIVDCVRHQRSSDWSLYFTLTHQKLSWNNQPIKQRAYFSINRHNSSNTFCAINTAKALYSRGWGHGGENDGGPNEEYWGVSQ